MTRRIHFMADYNHRWASRAMTHFRAGHSYTVKTEVRDAALAKGVATDAPEQSMVGENGKTSRRGPPRRVAGRDSRSGRDHTRPDELESDGILGSSDGVPVVPLADK